LSNIAISIALRTNSTHFLLLSFAITHCIVYSIQLDFFAFNTQKHSLSETSAGAFNLAPATPLAHISENRSPAGFVSLAHQTINKITPTPVRAIKSHHPLLPMSCSLLLLAAKEGRRKTRDAMLDKIPVAPNPNIAASTTVAPHVIRTVKR
jgi:hypothetical protein